MTLSDIEAYDITLTNATGRLSLTNLSATEITAETTDAKNPRRRPHRVKRLTITTTNAPIISPASSAKNLTSGRQTPTSPAPSSATNSYSRSRPKTDQTAYPKSKENERSKYKLNAKTNGGDIDINFVS